MRITGYRSWCWSICGEERRHLSIHEALDYAVQLASALAHAHRNGVLHRDLKTSNAMLTAEGVLKLTDFGLAKLRGQEPQTFTGALMGTAAYMSPEQAAGRSTDNRSDIFSFGVVL